MPKVDNLSDLIFKEPQSKPDLSRDSDKQISVASYQEVENVPEKRRGRKKKEETEVEVEQVSEKPKVLSKEEKEKINEIEKQQEKEREKSEYEKLLEQISMLTSEVKELKQGGNRLKQQQTAYSDKKREVRRRIWV